ncbi:MFS transporter [Bartonella sp. DGB1]|uniref:MFS transporter n=1 Tax=Bartonella sp. DGB1 TaxID=3239807 RepID=UPI003525155B
MMFLFKDRNIRYLCITVILLSFVNGFIKTSIPIISKMYGYDLSYISLSQTFFLLSWPIFGIFFGVLFDRYKILSTTRIFIFLFIFLYAVNILILFFNLDITYYIFIYSIFSGIIVVFIESLLLTIPPLIMKNKDLYKFYSLVIFMELGVSSFISPIIATGFIIDNIFLFFLFIGFLLILSLLTLSIALNKKLSNNEENNAISIKYIFSGFSFLYSNKIIFSITTITFFLSLVFGAFMGSLIVFITDANYLGLSIQKYGIMLSAYALGTMFGCLCLQFFNNFSIRLAIIIDIIGTIMILLVPAFSKSVLVVWIAIFMAGVGLSFWLIAITPLRQSLTPKNLLGRANSAFRVIGYTGLPLGSFLVSILGTILSLKSIAILVSSILIIAFIITVPTIWSLDELASKKVKNN